MGLWKPQQRKQQGQGGQKNHSLKGTGKLGPSLVTASRGIYPFFFLLPEVYSLQNTFMCINLILALTQSSKGGKVGILKR